MSNREKEVRALYRQVEDILFENEYDIYGKMNTHDSGTGFSLYIRAKRKYTVKEDAILVRTSDHPAFNKLGRDVPDYSILVMNKEGIRQFKMALKARIVMGKNQSW